MNNKSKVEVSLYVEHGREQEAANFYKAAFAAEQIDRHYFDGELVSVELLLGSLSLAVVGSNPTREKNPSLGGPFFPKTAGAVSTVITLIVSNLEQTMERAIRAGATIRDDIELDVNGYRAANVFDPFGHIWGLNER